MPSSSEVRAARAYVEAYLKDRALYQGLDRMERRLQAFGRSITAWGRAVSAAGTKLMIGAATALAPLLLSIRQASAMEETMNKFNVVFGQSAAQVKRWSDEFAGSIGRSREQIASFMAGSQDLFVPLGFAAAAAEDMSKQITRLTVDLASFNNKADADVLRDLHAALTGSGEVMKKYGVIVSEAAVKQELLNQRIDPKVATDQEKVQARLNIILRGTTAAQGDAIRSAGSLANQSKALQAAISDAAAEIGGALLPVVAEMAAELRGAITAIIEWVKEHQGLIKTSAQVAAGLLAVGAALKVIGTAAAIVAANPMVVLFAGAAAAALALSGALDRVAEGTAGASHEAQRALEIGDRRRAAALAQMEELGRLAQKESLNNEEMERATDLIDTLQSRYGNLGLEIDATTGRIVGFTQAQKALRAELGKQALREVEAEILEAKANVEAAKQSGEPGLLASTSSEAWKAAYARRAAAIKAAQARMFALIGRREIIKAQLKTGELTDEPLRGPGAEKPGKAPALGEQEKKLRDALDFGNKLEQIRIGAIADRHAREIASIKARYSYEIATAKDAGQTIKHLAALEAAEIAAAKKRHAAEEAAEAKRAAEVKKEKETALQDEIARLRIEATLKGKAKELALLKVEQDRAIREGLAAGVDPRLIREKYALMRAAALAPEEAAQAKASTAGTFSAYGAARGLGGFDVQTRIASNTEKTAQNLLALLTEAKNAKLVFG